MNRFSIFVIAMELLAGFAGSTQFVLAQSDAAQPAAPRPVFEVASIKPHTSDDRRFMISPSTGGRFNASGAPLKMLVSIAYKVQDYQISGGPSWIDSDRWDIVAKTEDGSNSKWIECLQALLEDRYKLTIRRETREMPIYALVVAKAGPKLRVSEGDCPPRPPGPPPPPAPGKLPTPPCGNMFGGPNHISGMKVPLSEVAPFLSRILGRVVVDKTGLTAKYDIELDWAPDQNFAGLGPGDPGQAPPDNSGPSIYSALQEQLGLRLESQKGPVEVLIIDHVEKPSEN